MPWIAATAVLLGVAVNAGDYVPPEPIPPAVQLAAFHELLSQEREFVQCLTSNELDPPPEVMERVRASAATVVPGSRCAAERQGAYLRSDRRPARIVTLRGARAGEDQATVEYTLFHNSLWGENGIMSLRRKGPVWIVYARVPGPVW